MKRILSSLWLVLVSVFSVNAQESQYYVTPDAVYFPETKVGAACEVRITVNFASAMDGQTFDVGINDYSSDGNCPFSFSFNGIDFHPANEYWWWCCVSSGSLWTIYVRFAPEEVGDFSADLYIHYGYNGRSVPLSGSASQNPSLEVVSMSIDSISSMDMTAATANFTLNVNTDVFDNYGSGSVSEYGVAWGTSPNPQMFVDNSNYHYYYYNGGQEVVGSVRMENLNFGTTYYVRGFANCTYNYTHYEDVGWYVYQYPYFYNMTFYSNKVSFTAGIIVTATPPVVVTGVVSDIMDVSATCTGEVTADGGAEVTKRGVCWDTVANPIVTGAHTSNGIGIGSFTSSLTGLTPNTTYYVRAYAINSVDTAYGEEVSFTTLSPCIPSSFQFADTICESELPYIWNGITYTGSGNYTQTLVNAGGCDSLVTLSLTVNPNPHITYVSTSDSVICDGGEMTLAVIPNDNNLDGCVFTWYRNGAVIHGASGTSFTDHPIAVNGESTSYTYTFVASVLNTGCETTVHSPSITVVTQPVVEITRFADYDSIVCDGGSTAVQAVVTGGYGDANYQWYKNGELLQNETNESLSINNLIYGVNDAYTVEVLQEGTGCYGNASSQINTIVTIAPSYTVEITGYGNVCEGSTLNLEASLNNVLDGDMLVYQWYVIMNNDTMLVAGANTPNYSTSDLLFGNVYEWYVNVTSNFDGCSIVSSTVPATLVTVPVISITGLNDIIYEQSTTLTASGADFYKWSLDSVVLGNDESVTVSPDTTTTYLVTGYRENVNLVVNGDFEQGKTGFSSGYNYVNDGSWGHYYIGHDNHEMWSWDNITILDHTTGSGQWMMVDAYADRNIWSQTVKVAPNTDYVFSAWFVTNNMANVRFEINGQQGEIFTTPQQQNVWERRYFVWNSGNSTSATLKIKTGAATQNGHDFGIDDISFTELICETAEAVTVTVNYLPAVTTDTVFNIGAFFATCMGDVTSEGSAEVNERGVCWSINHEPTIADAHTSDGTGMGEFMSLLTGLEQGTTYYVRAYATSSVGTVYGEELSFTTVICPGPTTVDTVICSNDLPFIWNEQTVAEYGTYTAVLQTAAGCDSTVTLTVNRLSYLLSDDFNDGVIDPAKWTYTGNSVTEENGLLMLQQNITDQDVHLKTVNLGVPASGKIAMDRRFMVHRSSDPRNGQYYYGKTDIFFNGDESSYIIIEYTYAYYYDDAYQSIPRDGIHVFSKINGVESYTRLCDIRFDTWLTENVEIDFSAGTFSYYMDTLVATVNIPGLSSHTVDYYNVVFIPYGWWTGHQHYMDKVDIYGDMGLVSTNAVSDISDSSAICGGNVAPNDCHAYTSRGVCWSTSHNPTISDAHTNDGVGTGEFVSAITDLVSNNIYYVRAYVTDSLGAAYGQEESFTVCSPISSEFEDVICESALPYIWNEVPYYETGDYVQTLHTAANCDSVVTLHLTVYPFFTVSSVSASESVCEGSNLLLTAMVENASDDDELTYQWYRLSDSDTSAIVGANGITYSDASLLAGSYGYWVEVYGMVSGCYAASDTSHVNILPTYSTMVFDTICDGVDYDFYGQSPTGSGSYTHILQAANGCDSVVTLHLTVHPSITSHEYLTICENELPYNYGDTVFEAGTPQSSIVEFRLLSQYGCDSTVILHLTVLPSIVGEFTSLTPVVNQVVSTYPIRFTWNALENVSAYDLYVWPAGESRPQQPTASRIHGTQYIIAELPNQKDYQWFITAYNTCDTVSSSIRQFSLSMTPVLAVTSGNPVDFGEVPFNSSRSISFQVNGTALDSSITYQLTGTDVMSFSLAPINNWDSLHGGGMQLTFHPTVPKSEYTAQMIFQSDSLVETIMVKAYLSDYLNFTTYVDSNVYAMDSEIPIHGRLTNPLNEPVGGQNVEVYVKVMEYVRTLPATSDANGEFTVIFTPQHSESGYYTVGSRRVGGNSLAAHDDFNIPGMILLSSDWILWNPTLDQADTGVIAIRNRSQIPLTNIQVTPMSLPNGCSVQFLPLNLEGMSTGELQYVVNGSEVSTGINYQEVRLNAVSDEGASMSFSAWYYCIPQRADLDVMPTSIVTTMTRGKSKVVDFLIYNNGTGSTGDIVVSLPPVPWMSVVGGDTLPSLAAHDSAYISIRLSAGSETDLIRYTGNFTIHSERGEGVSIPYNITAISDSTGTLVVDVTDEYAWNTNGGHGPHLSGANVTVKGYYSLETVATGVTDDNGLFVVDNLPEGWYKLIIRASRHAEYQNYLYVTAGDTNLQDIFIPFQAITYSWDVVPTEIEDVYTYELNVDFETHVPKPVVTMDIDRTLPLLEDCEMAEFNVIATNHGLVAAMDVSIIVPQSDYFVFTPLISHLDSLPAQTAYTIPVIYQRKDCAELGHLSVASAVQPKSKSQDYYDRINCNKKMFNLTYYYICRVTHWETVISRDLKYDAPQEGCEEDPRQDTVVSEHSSSPNPSSGPAVGPDIVINPDWVRNYPYINLPDWSGWDWSYHSSKERIPESIEVCDPSLTPCQNALNGILECVPVLPVPVHIDSHNGIQVELGETAVEIAKDAMKAVLEYFGVGLVLELIDLGEQAGCVSTFINNIPNITTCIESWTNPYTASEIKDRDIATIINMCKFMVFPDIYVSLNQGKSNTRNVTPVEIPNTMTQESGLLVSGILQPTSLGQNIDTLFDGQISDSGRVQMLAACLEIDDSPWVEEYVNAFVDRWNHSIEAWNNGYFTAADAPAGYDTNFFQIDTSLIREFYELNEEAVSQGYANIFERYDESINAFRSAIDDYQNNLNPSSLCATVTVQFSQRMTMTREAFEGTLTIDNGHESQPIQNIDVDFVIRDENGVDCTHLFQVNFLSYNNMTGTNGNASLDAGNEGSIIVQFIPTKQAAPEIAKVYSFGGTLSFIDPFTGENMINDLYPVDITVNPSPDLYVNYFMQRDILGDDPLTEERVEPIVPAELGVIIHNRGAGMAKNVILETAEPRIIDNEKGLAVDFAMYGAAFNGSERQLGLMAIPFGNIEPNRTGVGEWWFTSTLLGHFVSYEAHVIHNNSFGNPDLSLVSSLEIHPLIHTVYAYGNLDDGINDFLVDDVEDYGNYPDKLYFSNGSRTDVAIADSISFDHYVTPLDTIVQLTLDPSRIGWNYDRTWDPGRGQYKLISCTRNSDQQLIPLSNVWQSFVTLPVGEDPIYENKLHIVDTLSVNQPTSYTLVFSLNEQVLEVDTILNVPDSIVTTPLSEVTVVFNKPIVDSTFNFMDMSLKCNNGANLLDENFDVERVDSMTYKLHFGNYTQQSGLFVLNIQTNGIMDQDGWSGYYAEQAQWVQVLTRYEDSYDTVCDSTDYTYNGTHLYASGLYYDTLRNQRDTYDSLVYRLHLTVNHSNTGDTIAVVCESYDWYEHTNLTQSGDYTHTLTNAAGCDSVVTLHLMVHYGTHNVLDTTVCESFTWAEGTGETYTVSDTYTHAYTNDNGCASVDTLHLTVHYGTHNVTDTTVCESFTWTDGTGETYTVSDTYTHAYTNDNGCASVDTLHLTVNYGTHNVLDTTVCESFIWMDGTGETYTQTGTYTYEYTNDSGCSSADTLHLTVYYGTHNVLDTMVCESFTWAEGTGETYTQTGTYTYEYTNNNGCASVDTLHLTVNYGTHNVLDTTVCESFIWAEGTGETYTQTGTYTYEYTNNNGCASVDTLHLTVHQSYAVTDAQSICESELPYTWNGVQFTAAGSQTVTLQSVSGCDSVVTMTLNVLSADATNYTEEACDSYTWNGAVYTYSGDYTQTFNNAAGCDSVVTLHLTIYESTTSEYTIVTNESCYVWNGVEYCETGDYVQTLQTEDGCDSVVTLHLTIETGINDFNLNASLKAYPNPTMGVLNVELTMKNGQSRDVAIQIFDIYGKLLDVVETQCTTSLQQTIPTDASNVVDAHGVTLQTSIDLSHYANGVYFIKAVAEGNVMAVRKVVKNR